MPELVDYVEGFVVLNEQFLHGSSTAFPTHLDFTPEFHSNGSSNVFYCIEFAVHDDGSKNASTEEVSSDSSRSSK